ncbi:MAG: mannitol system or component [Epulopiscium sp.]|jgi:mannitol/fructose-specific phosphotransferase system IIA component|uniref:Mannitol-specific phosphotransferase enzyme IIA component n=1 Tax=Defluviitalea raffinosedens TaxID=1450156 RepID=A0A7C8HD95_9FIRM|nr:PTS sugar transporter subunit IIA [Defluviitalea raffinosedens]MBZ4668775.1 mannitol transporter subunit [Defluviitaleaceae bacterium]MDK2786986.1 mannitol system or component [Candidatus Epulonipiscium sp.]KAE9630211.1 PTS mannose transporter subunit IIA [Defluviitalea raffinosedens]MBM7686013.1 mannitol/fructose-specific phosphotransferase system IIA component [Defluviitalea raffinosedens]HHW67740.1 PTS sugar transporter subunit IIA [Candidatus Epulonipiscium sp.]
MELSADEPIQNGAECLKLPVLKMNNIKLGLPSVGKKDAIKMAGRVLADSGYVTENYIDAMLQREEDLSTYIGNGVAIPHGVGEAKKEIKQTGISILQFPEGVDFGTEKAYLVVGLAGTDDEHLSILSNLAAIIEDEKIVEQMKNTADAEFVYKVLTRQ